MVSMAKILSGNEYFAEKQGLKDKCKILRTAKDITSLHTRKQEGVLSSPPINFHTACGQQILLTFWYFAKQHLRFAFSHPSHLSLQN